MNSTIQITHVSILGQQIHRRLFVTIFWGSYQRIASIIFRNRQFKLRNSFHKSILYDGLPIDLDFSVTSQINRVACVRVPPRRRRHPLSSLIECVRRVERWQRRQSHSLAVVGGPRLCLAWARPHHCLLFGARPRSPSHCETSRKHRSLTTSHFYRNQIVID